MAKWGKSLLTRRLLETRDLEWADSSRMQFRDGECRNGIQYYELSLLGVINGCPILSNHFRLACTVEDDGSISGWKVIRWRS